MGDLEVTIPRVVIFRDAIVDLLQVEMGARFSKQAREGFCIFLNYVGGAYIYVRLNYTDRLRILASSWATANNKRYDELEQANAGGRDGTTQGAAGEGAERDQKEEGM